MKEILKQALIQRRKSRIVDESRVPSAVLVPIYDKRGEYYILLTQRTEKVQDHKGQVSFPGGAYEEQDVTLLNTALRECAEEIGLAAEAVEVLGELDDIATTTSSYVISPFVAIIPWPYSFKADPIEVGEIFAVPILTLLGEGCLRYETEKVYGQTATAYFYHYRGKVIWGATARILNQFLDIFTRVRGDMGE